MRSVNTQFAALTILTSVVFLSACSGGGGGSTPSTPVTLSGAVAAPGGTVAFNRPGLIRRMFGAILGSRADAAFTGVASVGAGVTLELLELDASGATVGTVLATATTQADGSFSMDAPAGFVADAKYVIRASGSTESIDARVSATTITVDPATDAASRLITSSVADLTTISTDEVDLIVSEINNLSTQIDATGLSAANLAAVIETEANNDEETRNVVGSMSTTGQICGSVTNSAGAGLANIFVVARDFGNWVTRAKTKTASDGSYCLNVPKLGDSNPDGGTFNGEYILGAINRTGAANDPLRSASEWWSTAGTAYNQFDAEKITVTNTTTVTKDFQLADGARISGTVTATATGNALEGVKVIVRDFDSHTPVAAARVKADGSYQVSVIAGSYTLEARNKTLQPYASQYFGAPAASDHLRSYASRETVTTGTDLAANFVLTAGNKLNGAVTVGVAGTARTGQRVMVDAAGAAQRLRTNRVGRYRIWLKPDVYTIRSYGQTLAGDLSAGNATVDFTSSAVSTISGTITDASVPANPVSQAKIRLYTSGGAYVTTELSNSDGTFEVYTDQTGDHQIEVRIDFAASFGSVIYSTTNTQETVLANGSLVNIAAASSTVALPAAIVLPDAGILTGTITNGTTGIPNSRVQVRSGGLTGANKFTTVRTGGDGSYILSLPGGITYDRVKMLDATLGTGNCDSVTITAAAQTVVGYNDGTGVCN